MPCNITWKVSEAKVFIRQRDSDPQNTAKYSKSIPGIEKHTKEHYQSCWPPQSLGEKAEWDQLESKQNKRPPTSKEEL